MNKKEELIQLAIDKGATNYKTQKYSYYLWMCTIQKWLREQHNIDIMIQPLLSENKELLYGSNVYSETFEETDSEYKTSDIFESYELALEDALVEGLKEVKV